MSGLATKTVAAGPDRRTSVPLLISSTIRPPLAGIWVAPVPRGARAGAGFAEPGGGASAGGGAAVTVPRRGAGVCASAASGETASARDRIDPARPESRSKRIAHLETHFEAPA